MHNDEHYMGEALALAAGALEKGEFPVGCVVVAAGRVLAGGARTGSRPPAANELDHAEITALRQLADRRDAAPASGATIYCTMEPCLMCFGAILLSGIGRIVDGFEDVMGGGTGADCKRLAPLYRDRGLAVVAGVRREECLDLFARFFSDPQNAYWRGSLLAEYTLGQKSEGGR
jgi:tRNA(adenine34) deaminase